ncbi:hypothetical protein A2U01_0057264, partial [Trifolium medium]|nr:hypothetical protein [Trifolium medium]
NVKQEIGNKRESERNTEIRAYLRESTRDSERKLEDAREEEASREIIAIHARKKLHERFTRVLCD